MHVFSAILVSCFISLFTLFPAYADMAASSSNATASDAEYIFFSEPQGPGLSEPDEIYALSDAPAFLSLAEDQFTNCVYYDVTISGGEYILLLPSSYESLIWVDGSGYLWNMSASSIQGRLFEDTFDPAADTGKLLYLQPCLGNNFSTNHNYGSPNYVREYYWTTSNMNDRLSYTDTYVMVHVEDAHYLFQTSDTLSYAILFLVGCCLICLWKRGGR